MAYCSNCGNKLSENDKFCDTCGHPQNNIISKSVDQNNQQLKGKTNIFLFEGRVNRKEYFVTIIGIILIFSTAFYFCEISENYHINAHWGNKIELVLIIILPYIFLTQSVKRCRDIGKSLWFLFVPIISIIYLLLQKSKPVEIDRIISSPIKPKDSAGLR